MSRLLFTVAYAMTDRQLGQGSICQWGRGLSQLSKDVDQVPPNGVEHPQIPPMHLAIHKWKRILGNGYHSLVFAQEKPIPNSLAVRYVLVVVESVSVMMAMMRLLTVDVVESIVAET